MALAENNADRDRIYHLRKSGQRERARAELSRMLQGFESVRAAAVKYGVGEPWLRRQIKELRIGDGHRAPLGSLPGPARGDGLPVARRPLEKPKRRSSRGAADVNRTAKRYGWTG